MSYSCIYLFFSFILLIIYLLIGFHFNFICYASRNEQKSGKKDLTVRGLEGDRGMGAEAESQGTFQVNRTK